MASYYQIKTGVDGKERLVTVAAKDATPYEQVLVSNAATVPWEVLVRPGFLKIGVYGSVGDSKKPTVWAKTVQVWPGTNTDENAEPTPPSPSSYDILVGWFSGGQAGQYIYKNSDDDLDFAWNELPKGDKGDQGDKGDTGVGIASVDVNQDTSITINLDDGSSYSTGPLKGDKGDTGSKGDTGTGIASVAENNDTSLTFYMTDESTFTTTALKGDKGDKGATGATGTGISSIVMNNDYTLTVNLEDGTSYTTAPIRGATGATGATGNGIDHIYLNPNYTLSIFYTDGTSTTTGSIRGEQGEKGDPGDPGTTDYEDLSNKPCINGVELDGDKSFEDLGIDVFPEGGSTGDILMKGVGGAIWETPATSAEEDNTRPITSAAVYTEIGNINALLATI